MEGIRVTRSTRRGKEYLEWWVLAAINTYRGGEYFKQREKRKKDRVPD